MVEEITELFVQFGLTKRAATTYLDLLQTGRRTTNEVAEALHLQSRSVNEVLRELSQKGLVQRISTNPETFVAAYPTALIRPAIEKERKKLQQLSEARDRLLELWDVERTKSHGLPAEWCPVEEGFTVLYNKDDIINKRLDMFTTTERRLWIISTEFWLPRWADVLLDYFVGTDGKCKIDDVKILLPITPNNVDIVKRLSACFKIRHASMMSNIAIVISDCKEAMYTGVKKDVDELETVELTPSLWSNNAGFIEIQSSLFQTLWDRGVEARFMIQEIETGKPVEVTRVITDYQEILADFTALLKAAQSEIFLWVRGESLPILAPLIPKDARKRGVNVIVMADINKDNLQAAQDIAEYADVRHIPQIVRSTGVIIDEQAMQVLLYSFSEKGAELYNSIYTNTKSFVETQHSMMEDMWHAGIELRYREQELTAGRVVQTIQVIKKRENVFKTFYEMLDRSKNEFNVIQTRMGVKRLYNLIKDKDMPHVTYRLLAPIESINIEEARLLTQHFEIRHLESETGAAIFIADDDELLATSYIYDTGDLDKVVYKSAFRTDISEFIFIEKDLFNSFWYDATPLNIREQELPVSGGKRVIAGERLEKRPIQR
ncbi:MAG TPA: helix-turn-helix domain-containing protein [Candidatus Bathyarchaeia archaeon]|nr:helix-turn-helix domain-containing protein [Candidatus Bathyarchaeia archaeon]